MGWGTDFKADIFLNRMNFENKSEVEDKIEELRKSISDAKVRIKMHASANVKDLIPEDWKDQPIDFISNELDVLFEWHDECLNTLQLLNLYKEKLEEDES